MKKIGKFFVAVIGVLLGYEVFGRLDWNLFRLTGGDFQYWLGWKGEYVIFGMVLVLFVALFAAAYDKFVKLLKTEW